MGRGKIFPPQQSIPGTGSKKCRDTETIVCLALWRKRIEDSVWGILRERLLGNEDRGVREVVGCIGNFQVFILLSICWEDSRRLEQKDEG